MSRRPCPGRAADAAERLTRTPPPPPSTASWCGPCKRVAPQYAKLSLEHPEADFAKVDVDANRAVAKAEGIEAMPTFNLYVDGAKKSSLQGANMGLLLENLTALKGGKKAN